MMPRKTIFQTLKKLSALSLILALVLTTLAGCGESAVETATPFVEPVAAPASSGENTGNASEENEPVNEKSPEQGSSDEDSSKDGQSNLSAPNAPDQSDSASATQNNSAPQNNIASQSDSELDGTVKTVETDSFVVSQSFVMPAEDSENGELMIAPAEGSEDEVLITVHISESTVYKIHTVKNGGVNGDSDVERTEGSFADIQEKTTVNAKGYYENGDFESMKVFL